MPKLLYRYPLPKIFLLLFLLGLICVGAAPGYLTGKWRWAAFPQVSALPKLRELRKTGLTVDGWKILNNYTLLIGGHDWFASEIQRQQNDGTGKKSSSIALVMLMTQNDHADQPQVEWTDINGWQQWKTDSYTQVQFTVASPPDQPAIQVEASFFRGRSEQQTYAVLQWYATPMGGNPAASWWFWADRRAQMSNRRVPWVAVSILIPIEPLGDIEKSRISAESLGKTVQAALMAGPFK